MASRTLNVSITGDSRDLQRALGQASRSTQQFEKRATASSRVAGSAFKTIAGLAGVGALTAGLRSTVKAAQDAQVSQAKMEAQLKASGLSYRAHAAEIDNVIQRVSKLSALDDEDLQDAFTNIVRVTGDVNKSLKLTGLAADFARAKHIDVAKAGEIVGKVAGGNTGILARYGIQIKKGADASEALATLQKKFSGQAEAYGKTQAGSAERFGVAIENLQEKIGKALLPVLAKVSDKAAKFIDEMTRGKGAGGRFADQMERVFHTVKDVLDPIIDSAKWLAKHPALLKAAGGAWVAYKTAALAQIAIVKAAELGLFGGGMRTKLAGEAGKTGSTVGRSFAAKAGAAAAAGIAGWEIGKWLRQNVPAVRDAGDFIGRQLGEAIFGGTKLQEKVDRMLGQIQDAGGNTLTGTLNDVTKKGSNALKNAAKPRRTTTVTKPNAGKASVSAFQRVGLDSGRGVGAHASSGSVTGDTAGLNSDFLNRLRQMSAGTGVAISVTSGFRTAAEQQALVNAKGIWSPSNPTGAAPVGSSMHEKGLAADISPGSGTFGGVAGRYGLAFTVPGEPWHIQPVGAVSGGSTPAAAGGSSGASSVAAAAKPKPPSQFDRFSNAIDRVDLQVAAGVISQSAGDTRKLGIVKKYLPKLRGDNRLRALGVRHDIQTGRRTAARDRRTARQEAAQDYADRKATFYDRTLSNPFLQAYLDHQDYLVATGQLDRATADKNKADRLQGAINSGQLGEADVVSAKGMISDLQPAAGSFASTLQDRLSEIDDMVRAGDLTPDAARALKIKTIQENLGNAGLSDRERLSLRGDLRDLQNEGQQALADNTAELKALREAIEKQTKFGESVAATEAGAMARWVTSVVSRVQGYDIAGRGLTPSFGVARRP